MDALIYLIPITFIFAIAALTKVMTLEKEVVKLKEELKKSRDKTKA